MDGKKRVKLEELLPIIEEKLSAGGTVVLPITGTSMLPLLVAGGAKGKLYSGVVPPCQKGHSLLPRDLRAIATVRKSGGGGKRGVSCPGGGGGGEKKDPATGFWKRVLVKLASVLPIEWLL